MTKDYAIFHFEKPMKLIQKLSGGMDSTTLLYFLKNNHKCEVKTLSVDYGQRHSKEIDYAKWHCEKLGVEHRVADLKPISHLLGNESVLMNKDIEVPDGHYEEPIMKQTVVPNRNMLMIACATSWAIAEHYEGVAYGAHAGDHTIYPDCRKEFADALDKAMRLCDFQKMELVSPFLDNTKSDIAKLGHELGIDFTKTWSCYKGLDKQCGKCATCIERREAFFLAGVTDPTEYEENAPTLDQLITVNFKFNDN